MILQEDVKVVANCLCREVREAVRLSGKEVVQSVREELDKQARYLSSILIQDPRHPKTAPVQEMLQHSQHATLPHAVETDNEQSMQPSVSSKKVQSSRNTWTAEDDETWATIIPVNTFKHPASASILSINAPTRVSRVSLPHEDWPPGMPARFQSPEGWFGEQSCDTQKRSITSQATCSPCSPVFTMVSRSHLSKTADRIKNVRKTLRQDKSQLTKNFRETVSSMSTIQESGLTSEFNAVESRYSRILRFHRGVYASMLNGTFDACVCCILLANSIFIGIRVDMTVREVEAPEYFRALDVFFCIAFMTELGLRIAIERMRYFLDGELWNYFDVLLVGVQLADLILYFVADDDHGLDQGIVVRILRVIRLVRVLRLLRVIRFVADLRKVVYLMMGSLQSFTWTMSLLMLLMYILAVFFTQLISDNMAEIQKTENWGVIDDSFGSLLRSVQTLYKAITGGMDWQDASNPLIEAINPVVGIIFACYTAFAILVLLNLVTGVFVDSALKLTRADKEVDLTRKAYQVFRATAQDHSGTITWEEFKEKLNSPAMAEFFEALEISLARAEDLFQLLEDSGDGLLDLEELVAGGLLLQGPAKAIDVAALFKYLQSGIDQIESDLRTGVKRVEDRLEDMLKLMASGPLEELRGSQQA